MKNINLLCKGPSLKYFNELPNSEFVILANDFDGEISQIKEFSDYLEKQTIHLVINMVLGGANAYHSIDFFNRFNVVELIRPYLEGIREPGSSGQNIPLEENFLGKHHMSFMHKKGDRGKYPYDYAGTGIAAFAYAMLDCSANIVNVIGLDFYDNLNYGMPNYLVPDKEGRDNVRDFWTPEEMQEHFCKLVKGNPDIQVNLTTICKNFIDGMEDIENLNITTRDPELPNKKKLAVVVGGWHYPYEYYKQVRNQKIPEDWECDYFVVSHRDPELPNVLEEKQVLLKGRSDGILQSFDRQLYDRIITKQELKDMGFTYDEEQSSIGDLYQLNQWVKRHYTGQYDKVLFTHDDNYILNDEFFLDILEKRVDLFLNSKVNEVIQIEKEFDWKHLSSGVLENTIVPRTSFTFLDKELLDKLAPDFEEVSTKGVDLDRSGETTTIYNLDDEQVDRSPLSSWNWPSRNFKNWMSNNGYTEKSVRMSPLYRVNKYLIEGERGFIWTKEDEERILHNLSQYYDLT